MPRMDDPIELLREGGRSALELSERLYDSMDPLLEKDPWEAHDEAAISIVRNAALEIRRQGLCLMGEADMRGRASFSAPHRATGGLPQLRHGEPQAPSP